MEPNLDSSEVVHVAGRVPAFRGWYCRYSHSSYTQKRYKSNDRIKQCYAQEAMDILPADMSSRDVQRDHPLACESPAIASSR